MSLRESRLPSREFLDRHCPFQPVLSCSEIQARQAKNVFDLWDAWEKECLETEILPVPHWAVVWPAAEVLAKFLLDNPTLVSGKKVLEIGCGGGVASIAAAKCGADVTANDIDPVSLAIAEENASANGVRLNLDHSNRIGGLEIPAEEVVLLADFFYFKSDSQAMEILLKEWKKAGKTILIADGGRAFAPEVFEKILHSRPIKVNRELEGIDQRLVRIIQY